MVIQRPRLAASLRRLDRALQVAQVRQVTEREAQLQIEWEYALQPILYDLYWTPLQQLEDAPEDDNDLEAWLLALLLGGLAYRQLVENIGMYLRWSADVGGSMALELLGMPGGFSLANEDVLGAIDQRRDRLTTPDSGLSLIDTTADHLTQSITQARLDEAAILATVGALVAGWVAVRSHLISITETSWGVATTQTETYKRNGVKRQKFTTREDGNVCPQCSPLNGMIVRVDNVPSAYSIPLHGGCRCMWTPVTDGWEPGESIWRGE